MGSERLADGFSTTIDLGNLPGISLFEEDVTIFTVEAGKPIDISTMRSIQWSTKAVSFLNAFSNAVLTVSFATDVIPQISDQVNVLQGITVTFPDGLELFFFGWIQTFEPNKFAIAEQPTAKITLQPSMVDLDGNEYPPFFFDAGPCKVVLLMEGGGDTFDCYTAGSGLLPRAGTGFGIHRWIFEPMPYGYPFGESFDSYNAADPVLSSSLTAGEGFGMAPWIILNMPYGYPLGDSFDTYNVQNPVANQTLSGGDGFTNYWIVL